jgi:aminoglycoside/choline kinase family phosphotransferase
MVRADGTLALVDIQDARRGPLGYDLASLVFDAYVDLDERLVSRLIERYRAALPDTPDPVAFDASLTLIAAQRMIKALGTFGYQASVLGRRRYLEGVPRTLSRLAYLLPRSPRTASIARHLRATGLLAD